MQEVGPWCPHHSRALSPAKPRLCHRLTLTHLCLGTYVFSHWHLLILSLLRHFWYQERHFTKGISMRDLIMALRSDPALPLAGYENVCKIFHLSEPQLPRWQNGDNNGACIMGLLRIFNV